MWDAQPGMPQRGLFFQTSPIFSPLNLLQGAQTSHNTETLSSFATPRACSGLGTNPLRFTRERCQNRHENRQRRRSFSSPACSSLTNVAPELLGHPRAGPGGKFCRWSFHGHSLVMSGSLNPDPGLQEDPQALYSVCTNLSLSYRQDRVVFSIFYPF